MKLYLNTLEERLVPSTVLATGGGATMAMVQTMAAPKVVIDRTDRDAIRADPQHFATLLEKYRESLIARLRDRVKSPSDQDLTFCLAVSVAYQMAYYRSPRDPSHGPAPRSTELYDLLHTFKLQCREYCYLAAGLFRIAYPEAEGTSLQLVRFTRSAMGTHSQLFYVSPTATIMGDPTIGLVASTTLEHLQSGQRLNGTHLAPLSHRAETSPFMRQNMATFAARVYSALRSGYYTRAVIGSVEVV